MKLRTKHYIFFEITAPKLSSCTRKQSSDVIWKLTLGTVVVVGLLEARGAVAGVSLVARETQVTAATIAGPTAVLATWRGCA